MNWVPVLAGALLVVVEFTTGAAAAAAEDEAAAAEAEADAVSDSEELDATPVDALVIGISSPVNFFAASLFGTPLPNPHPPSLSSATTGPAHKPVLNPQHPSAQSESDLQGPVMNWVPALEGALEVVGVARGARPGLVRGSGVARVVERKERKSVRTVRARVSFVILVFFCAWLF